MPGALGTHCIGEGYAVADIEPVDIARYRVVGAVIEGEIEMQQIPGVGAEQSIEERSRIGRALQAALERLCHR